MSEYGGPEAKKISHIFHDEIETGDNDQHQCRGGTEAEDELARLAPLGSTLWVAPDEDSWDDYDRRLFYLWTNDGEFINLSLVEGGFAEAIRVAPNDLHYETLLAAERDAALAGLGMWGECSSR